MEPDQIVKMSWSGNHEGKVLPSSEWRFHRDILVDRPDLNAIVHTHSPYATAVSVLERGIPAIHYRIAALGGPDIRCAPYALFGSQDLADLAVVAMRDRRACLLAHHGVIAGHSTLKSALLAAEIVEELARLYLLCLPMGSPPVLPPEAIAQVIERHKTYGQQPAAVKPTRAPRRAIKKQSR
jgi:L-fuculose-phosphate aldolase